MDLDNFAALLEALRNNKSVKNLTFKKQGTEIGKEKTNILVQFLKDIATNNSLEYLNLDNLRVGVDAAVDLAYSLKDNKTLKELILTGNELDDRAAIELAYALKYNKSLKNLVISNNKIGKLGLEFLLGALKINKTLH